VSLFVQQESGAARDEIIQSGLVGVFDLGDSLSRQQCVQGRSIAEQAQVAVGFPCRPVIEPELARDGEARRQWLERLAVTNCDSNSTTLFAGELTGVRCELDSVECYAGQTQSIEFPGERFTVEPGRAKHFKRRGRAATDREIGCFEQTDAGVQQRFGKTAHIRRRVDPGQARVVEELRALPAAHLHNLQIEVELEFGLQHQCDLADGHAVANGDGVKAYERLQTIIKYGTSDIDSIDRVRPVENDKADTVVGRRDHGIAHGRNISVETRPDVLNVEHDRVNVVEHRSGRPSHLAVKTDSSLPERLCSGLKSRTSSTFAAKFSTRMLLRPSRVMPVWFVSSAIPGAAAKEFLRYSFSSDRHDRAMPMELTTEASNPDSADLDRLETLELVQLINAEDAKVAAAVGEAATAIAAAIDVISTRLGNGGRLIYVGAGTSGRLGVLDAAECPPTFNADPEQVIGLIAGGPAALVNPVEGAEDSPELAIEDLQTIDLSAKDAVVGIAASGQTPYVLAALDHARSVGAAAIGFACNRGAPIEEHADIMITVVTGPEVLAGSTRMKAGTATKMVLNMLTTGSMVRLGKTYGNLMVDLQATNAKLITRTVRILQKLSGQTAADAEALLQTCNGELKTAIVCNKLDLSPDAARAKLEAANGRLRLALEENTHE